MDIWDNWRSLLFWLLVCCMLQDYCIIRILSSLHILRFCAVFQRCCLWFLMMQLLYLQCWLAGAWKLWKSDFQLRSFLFHCVSVSQRDFQFFHLCSIYASFLPVRAPPQFVSHPHKSPTSNPSPSPCVPSSLLLAPVFICQLTANPCPTPPRLYLFSRARALPNNHHHPTQTSWSPCVTRIHCRDFSIFSYFRPQAVPEYFRFVYSEFLLPPSPSRWMMSAHSK